MAGYIPLVQRGIQMLILSKVLPNHDEQVEHYFDPLNNLRVKLLVHEELTVAPTVSLKESNAEQNAGVKTKHFLRLTVVEKQFLTLSLD